MFTMLIKESEKMVGLGDEVMDTVSGFKGVAVGEYKFLQGCTRISVQPKVDKDGKLPEAQTFDEPQLKITKRKKVKKKAEVPGGPMPYKPKEKDTPLR